MSTKVFSVGDFIKFIEEANIPLDSNLAVELDNGDLGLITGFTAFIKESWCYPQVVVKIEVK